jgi:hypothetical protein
MTTVALSVELEVDIPGSKITSKVQSVHDAAGSDRTTDFRQFCAAAELACNSKAEIEIALHEYVKARTHTLP